MHRRIARHLRANVVAYLALGLAVGGGGGYALAANRATPTHVCADRTGARLLHLQARCRGGQQALSWVQTDVPVSQAALWAHIDSAGRVVAGGGVRVQHLGTGTYAIVVRGPCSQVVNSPTVSIVDNNPPLSPNGSSVLPSGAFPVGWLGYDAAGEPLRVFTGVVVNGSFTPADRDFDIQDFC